MSDVNKKVLLDLFAAPSTILPIGLGVTGLLAGWALGSSTFALLGFLGVLIGGGLFATRLIFGLDKITDQAYQKLVEKEQEKRQAELDALDAKLVRDRDTRTQEFLRQLRHLYEEFHKDVRTGEISGVTGQMVEKVEEIFSACVKQLDHSYEMHETLRKMSGKPKKELERDRDAVVEEVGETVVHLSRVINEFHGIRTKKGASDLSNLRKELETTMRVAKQTEEHMAEIMGTKRISELD